MLPRITEYVHNLLESRIKVGDTVIDATMGNGHDSRLLAQLVGEQGAVYAYDVQEQAIHNTRKLLEEHDLSHRVTLKLESHANMQHPKQSISAVVFNLGYLPGSDKTITTNPDSTLEAVRKAMEFLSVGGIVILVVYWGHSAGKEEKQAIEDFACQIPYPEYLVMQYQYVNPGNCPPFVIVIEKRKGRHKSPCQP